MPVEVEVFVPGALPDDEGVAIRYAIYAGLNSAEIVGDIPDGSTGSQRE